ncbi:MAG: hypothetical protein ACHP6H_01640, partial [Legionellales bacterium]
VLEKEETYLDDWALTAMLFGVCNRQAYFSLVRGRVATDYVVPGIIDTDDENPPGLKITDEQAFNQMFACNPPEAAATQEQSSVLFIPSNQREGEPLHLYRRLMNLRDCLQGLDDLVKQALIGQINAILNQVHQAIASGQGLSKPELKELLGKAKACINQYHNLDSTQFREQRNHEADLLVVIEKMRPESVTVDHLLEDYKGTKCLELLCTYPRTDEHKRLCAQILVSKIANQSQFNDKFVEKEAPCKHLLQECIAKGQSTILVALLGLVTTPNPAFIKKIGQEGLLHYAAEQGLTEVFKELLTALKRAGATPQQLLELIMLQYDPKKGGSMPNIKWSTNCLLTVIKSNNLDALMAILELMTAESPYRNELLEALNTCALLGNTAFFNLIFGKFNELHLKNPITHQELLGMTLPPEALSPYHLFLRDEKTLEAIPFDALRAEEFLLGHGAHTLLIAAKQGNYQGVRRLITFASTSSFTKEQFSEFFVQKDPEGKNLLNYILEQQQFTLLPELFDLLTKHCDKPAEILVHWLSNPNPLNPLQNLLNSNLTTDKQFAILHQIFDTLSADRSNPESQASRATAFLVNQEWLIDKAQDAQYHEQLRGLMRNANLSSTMKQLLFSSLRDLAEDESEAKKFYTELCDQVTPKQPVDQEPLTTLQLTQGILVEVSRQRADLQEGLWQKLCKVKKDIEVLVEQNKTQINQQQATIDRLEAEKSQQLDPKDRSSLMLKLLPCSAYLTPEESQNYTIRISTCTPADTVNLEQELDQLKAISNLVDQITIGIEQRDKTLLKSAYSKTKAIKEQFTALSSTEKLALIQKGDTINTALNSTDKKDPTSVFLRTIKEKRNLFGFFEAKSFTEFKEGIEQLTTKRPT